MKSKKALTTDKALKNRIVIEDTPSNRKRFNSRYVDFSGRDTKNGVKLTPQKIHEGDRGGFFVIKAGKKVYLEKR